MLTSAAFIVCGQSPKEIISVTSTVQTALCAPAAAVIVAFPFATAVTTPSVTVATPVSLLVQVTVLSKAFSGRTVAVRVSVSPVIRVNSVLLSVTLVTGIISHTAVRVMSPVEPFAIFSTNSSPFFHPPKVQPVFVASKRVIASLSIV